MRNQLFVRFLGEGSIASIRGASLLNGRQHADTTLVAGVGTPSLRATSLCKSLFSRRNNRSSGVSQETSGAQASRLTESLRDRADGLRFRVGSE